MDITKDALAFLMDLRKPTFHGLDEEVVEFSDKHMDVVCLPLPEPLHLAKLSGLSEVIEAADDEVILHVASYMLVNLYSKDIDLYGRRVFVAVATHQAVTHQFGQFLDPEQFVIWIQSLFVPGIGDTDYLLKTASNLSSENVAKAEDDGISQKATVKRGVSLGETTVIRSRVSLAPYRTFREAEQPASDFIFRLRSRENLPPTCALFEADGGLWKLNAIDNIAAYLSRNNSDVPVIA